MTKTLLLDARKNRGQSNINPLNYKQTSKETNKKPEQRTSCSRIYPEGRKTSSLGAKAETGSGLAHLLTLQPPAPRSQLRVTADTVETGKQLTKRKTGGDVT